MSQFSFRNFQTLSVISGLAIGVREQFIFWGAHTFLVRFARIPTSAENLAEGGGGGGVDYSCTFFLRAQKYVLYFSIGLGVHDILQVIPAKKINEPPPPQKKKKKKKKWPIFFFWGGKAVPPVSYAYGVSTSFKPDFLESKFHTQ